MGTKPIGDEQFGDVSLSVLSNSLGTCHFRGQWGRRTMGTYIFRTMGRGQWGRWTMGTLDNGDVHFLSTFYLLQRRTNDRSKIWSFYFATARITPYFLRTHSPFICHRQQSSSFQLTPLRGC